MFASSRFVVCVATAAALTCGGRESGEGGADGDTTQSSSTDAGGDGEVEGDGESASGDTGEQIGPCGTEELDVDTEEMNATRDLVVARDGTLYYLRDAGLMAPDFHIGRFVVGGEPEVYFELPEGMSAWGLVLDASNETLYVAAPNDGILAIDTTASPPISSSLAGVDTARDVTFDFDGQLYYPDAETDAVWRIDPVGGQPPEQVTVEPIPGIGGIALSPDGALAATSFPGTPQLVIVTMADGVEASRQVTDLITSRPNGVVFDEEGGIYVTSSNTELLHIDEEGSQDLILDGLGNFYFGMDFGAGLLRCNHLYMSGHRSRLYSLQVHGAPVPWH